MPAGLVAAVMGGVLALPGDGLASPAAVLPSGAQVSAGSAQIRSDATTLTVSQSSARAAINWQSFSIGGGATVNFVQPDASSVTLNRVVGHERSVIDGALNANGSVYLLNANGVLFNRSAQVNVGGLIASTRDLSDADFMAGRSTFTGSSEAGILNLGTLEAAEGGHVALLGRTAVNEGLITARLGTVALAAGNRLTLDFNGRSLVRVSVDEGALEALVANREAIRADGGQVVLTARGLDQVLGGVVNNTGEIRAQTVQEHEGRIYLLGGLDGADRVEVAGRLDASAPAGGAGGFIETSAAQVNIGQDLQVSTRAASGRTGTWLIDPTDFEIGAGNAAQTASGIGASTLEAALSNSHVTIQTVAAGDQAGDIQVNAPLTWSANRLTLEAHGDIRINAVMTAAGSSELDLKYGYNFDLASPSFDWSGHRLMMGMSVDEQTGAAAFTGKIRFTANADGSGGLRSGAGVLSINGEGYTLIASLGEAGSTTGLDLQGINGNRAGRYALAGDIDARATATWNPDGNGGHYGFTPIFQPGNWMTDTPEIAFSGKFNGLGHTIDGLHISQTEHYENIGLFGLVRSDGTHPVIISNLRMSEVAIDGGSKRNIGALIGQMDSDSLAEGLRNDLHHLIVQGTVSGTDYVGGVVGYARPDFSAAHVHADVQLTVSNGSSAGTAFGEIGGVVQLSDIHGRGSVQATDSEQIGGLIGYTDDSDAVMTRLSFTGTVSADENTSRVGGLIGYFYDGTLTHARTTVSVQAGDEVGGMIGYQHGGTISDSVASGTLVSGRDDVGGFIGAADDKVLRSEANLTRVVGRDHVGGFAGTLEGGRLERVSSSSDVEGASQVGGLLGRTYRGGFIVESMASGDVLASGDKVGGLVGRLDRSPWGGGQGRIDRSYATGSVTGLTEVGGLVGEASSLAEVWQFVNDSYQPVLTGSIGNLAIRDSYATGAVTATEGVAGGLVGQASLITLQRTYAAGPVTAYTAGGLVGANVYLDGSQQPVVADNLIQESFWDVTVSGLGSSGGTAGSVGGIGKTTGEMQRSSLYRDAEWHITTPLAGNRYPTLLWLEDGEAPVWQTYAVPLSTEGLASVASRPYDGSTAAALTLGTVAGLPEGASIGATGSFDSANAGQRTVTVNYTLTLPDSVDPIDYALTSATGTVAGLITPKMLAITGTTAASKTYDGTTAARISVGTLSGMVGDEPAPGLEASGVFASANAGQGRTVTVSYRIDNPNYTLAEGETLQADILPKALTIAGTTAASKTYDGTTAARISVGTLSGMVGDEPAPGLEASGVFASANAGQGRTVTVSYRIDNPNYTLTEGETLQADILPRLLTLIGSQVAVRTADGTTAASVTPGTPSGLVEGDAAPAVRVVSAEFDSAAVGPRTVTVTYALSDANYRLLAEQLQGEIRAQASAPSGVPAGSVPASVIAATAIQSVQIVPVLNPAGGLVLPSTRTLPGNVLNLPGGLTLPFASREALTVLSAPRAGETTQAVTLSQARQMMGGSSEGGTRDVRVPVSRNSLAEIVNGGVRLPGGVEQQLFVVQE